MQLVGGLASDVGDMALSFADLDDSVPVANKVTPERILLLFLLLLVVHHH